MPEGIKKAGVVIIGAGLAGMATAWQLGARGVRDVVVLEREDMPGLHSSGRNAAMIRQVVPEKSILPLARRGADLIRRAAAEWDEAPPFTPCGSLLTAEGARWERLRQEGLWTAESGAHTELWSSDQVCEAVPCTRGGRFDGAVWCPSDGVTDATLLLNGMFREARRHGVRLVTGCEALEVLSRSGKVLSVRTGQGSIDTPAVVNAAGPWAGRTGELAGALSVRFRPLRRHLYYTGPLDWAESAWPYVWDVSREVYFRPESRGLLLSPCDESEAEPGVPQADPSVQDILAEKLGTAFPRLLDVPLARSWAGLRTFAPDRQFVIGPDPSLSGFFWVAGLGGHGVTTSAAVGELAADCILDPESHSGSPFSPSRFAS